MFNNIISMMQWSELGANPTVKILFDLAIILLSTKFLGILMKKIGLPQVVGAILAGLILGPFALGNNAIITSSDGIKVLAEIGVVMIMFSAGLDTNLREIKQNGVASLIITLLGVFVPLGLGFVLSGCFFGFGSEQVILNLLVGTILTATSVGITVEVLKEMGKIKGKVGVSILSAAILDDIIGIIILTVVIGIGGQNEGPVNYGELALNVIGFFVFAIAVGIICHYLFKWLGKKFPRKRRVPIISLAVCFLFAFVAQFVFEIADITGAFVAGIMLSNMQETEYVERKVDINSYMIFSPVFFFNIGLLATTEGFNGKSIGFAVAFVFVGLLAKFIGCGGGAKICRYTWRESTQVGLGMMARGEVCLIVVQKGIAAHILTDKTMESTLLAAAILLVVVSALMTPILLKISYKTKKGKEVVPEGAEFGPTIDDNLVVPSVASGDVEKPIDMQASVYDNLAPYDDDMLNKHTDIHEALTDNDIIDAQNDGENRD